MRVANKPYVKIYENGILTNPITKENPYLSGVSSSNKKLRKSNNRKGAGLVVAKIGMYSFAKYKIIKQVLQNGKVLTQSILIN